MPNINAVTHFNFGFVPVDATFITEYMPKANGTYVKVFLYVLHNSYHQADELNTKSIASSLDMLESEVIQALQYWKNENLILLEQKDSHLHIEFLTPQSPKNDNKVTPKNENEKSNEVSAIKTLRLEKRPDYTPEEISVYSNVKEIKQMFLVAERYLGRLLSPTDLNYLYSFYDWLRLPTDVIELLLEYCISNGHSSFRYIEKVAINWADQGINSVEKAQQQISLFNKKYRTIMKAFGISRREPAPKEIEYMKKWLDQFQFDMEIIIEACNRTINNISQPNFQYTDSILSSWYNNKVRTFDDIRALDNTYAKNKSIQNKMKVVKPNSQSQSYKNQQAVSAKSFINFKQREDWDFDEIKRLEREYLERKLLEGR